MLRVFYGISYIGHEEGLGGQGEGKNGPIDKNVICHNSLKFARDIGFLFSHTRTRVCPGVRICVCVKCTNEGHLCA